MGFLLVQIFSPASFSTRSASFVAAFIALGFLKEKDIVTSQYKYSHYFICLLLIICVVHLAKATLDISLSHTMNINKMHYYSHCALSLEIAPGCVELQAGLGQDNQILNNQNRKYGHWQHFSLDSAMKMWLHGSVYLWKYSIYILSIISFIAFHFTSQS